MTALALPDDRRGISPKGARDAASLRAWLADRWAILFSHPEDFAQEQLEMDRWVRVLGQSLAARGVAAVALARFDRKPDQGWLDRLAALGGETAATLTFAASAPEAPVDFSAAALRARISRRGQRLAMIVDSDLRCRRALSYRLPTQLPSPLDLIGWTVALRKKERSDGAVSSSPGGVQSFWRRLEAQ